MSSQTSLSHIDLIKKRISRRSYEKRELTPADLEKIRSFIEEEHEGPFGNSCRFIMINRSEETGDAALAGGRIGTYGVIKGGETFIAGIVKSSGDDTALIDFGYLFERIIIFAESLDLGTCWLGGTFTRKTFSKRIHLEEGEIIPCISPIGYPLEKRTIREKTMRTAVKARKRFPWKEQFFLENFNTPLLRSDFPCVEELFESVRIAPSASNKQPWRLILSPETGSIHLYLHKLNGYIGNKLGFTIQKVDMGIAMHHLETASTEMNVKGDWVFEDPGIFIPPYHNGVLSYIASWNSPQLKNRCAGSSIDAG